MIRRAIASCLLAVITVLCSHAAHAQSHTVVAIFGGGSRTPVYEAYNQVLLRTMAPPSGSHVEYFEEYLDNGRFPDATDERRHAEFLRSRYAGKRIDLLISVDPVAVRFLLKFRDEAFPGVPVVFMGVRSATLARLALPADFIGIPHELDPAPTLRMGLALRPETREVVVVTGTATLDRGWEAAIRAVPLPAHVRLRVLTGLPIAAIERELAGLGRDAIVVTAAFRRDGAGQTFPGSMHVVERLSPISTAPIFHMYDTGVGHGAVGSFAVPQEALAAEAGEIARQLLEGRAVGAVTLPRAVEPVPIVDWRELRRWGMDEARLPPGTVVRFREAAFWAQYRYHAIAVALLIVLETALVAGLLLQRRQRRRVEERLRQSEQTMQLAANAAGLVMWNWDILRDRIAMAQGHEHPALGVPSAERDLAQFLRVIHPEDRDAVKLAIDRAVSGEGAYESEYRVVGDDGITRWYAGRGRVEHANGVPAWLRGITLDVTRRKEAEADVQRQRNELAHLSRVTMLGELSSSVAHELNQPLMAILSNAQAARMFINRDPVDLAEIAAILDDIVENDKRAGEIIWGMRKMLRKEEPEHELLDPNHLVHEVLRLLRGDLVSRGVTVETTLARDVPPVRGDRMQLQQVLVNLVVNACDAMAAFPKSDRVLRVRTESGSGRVSVSVVDRGQGIPIESMSGIFTPFFTTKKHGLGLGLSVCSSILASHGGELRAANNPHGGATFSFELDAVALEAVA